MYICETWYMCISVTCVGSLSVARFHKNVFKARKLWSILCDKEQNGFSSWRFLLECFFPVFKVFFRELEFELLDFVDILSLYGAFGILLVGFESFLLRCLFWVIGGQLTENQPLLRQIYKNLQLYRTNEEGLWKIYS